MRSILGGLTIKKAMEHLKRGDFTSMELSSAYRDVIKEKNKELNAYLEVFDYEEGGNGTLGGIPLAIKDNILIKGKKASAGSKILENYQAPYDSTAAKKLKEAGAVFLGRTNMDEFAMGSSTENSAFGPARNPYDVTRVPGGSSGGSVVAVAAGMALGALGSETGGSVRQPAALCGVVGLKPTYGAISRSGLIALGSSLDQIGPIAKTVEDVSILFEAMKGHDPLDSTTLSDEVWKKRDINEKLSIGVPWHLIEREGINDDVLKNFTDAIQKLKGLGYSVKDVELKTLPYALAVYYIIMPAEASSNTARYDGVKYGLHREGKDGVDDYFKTREAGFGAEVKRRIILGTYVLSAGYYDAYYNRAVSAREVIRRELNETFSAVNVIATPTTSAPAFKIGEKVHDPLSMYLEDVFTVPANIAGIPALSVPSGFVARENIDLPLGIQFMAPHTHEHTLFELGKAFYHDK